MTVTQPTESKRNFMLSADIFERPGLDIYAQMAFIVMKSYTAESGIPTLDVLAQSGRMSVKQAVKALQDLVDLHVLPHRVFRQIVGDFADDRLSWAAKGILAFCKDHRNVTLNDIENLASQSADNEQTIRKALRELRDLGYLEEYPELKKTAS